MVGELHTAYTLVDASATDKIHELKIRNRQAESFVILLIAQWVENISHIALISQSTYGPPPSNGEERRKRGEVGYFSASSSTLFSSQMRPRINKPRTSSEFLRLEREIIV